MAFDDLKNKFGSQVIEESAERAVVRPKDIETAADVVACANERGLKLVPVGGGTKRHWVDAVEGPAIELDMRSCCRVVEHSPEDMTITVEAGIVQAELAAVLAGHNQQVSLDPPHRIQATIGGILATNDSGPIRLAYGTARDLVLGMSVIQPDGTVTRSGGKVVKNVAGYDMHKLHIGAFGTLGPIASVTFRLRPLPEARGFALMQPRSADDAERMLAAILSGPTRPTMLELLNTRMAKALDLPPRLTLVTGFEDNTDAVVWQCEQMRKTFSGEALKPAVGDAVKPAAGETGKAESQVFYERLCETPGAAAAVSFKATTLSSRAAAFVETAERICGAGVRLISHAGNGITYGLLDEAPAAGTWKELIAAVAELGGSFHLRGPLPATDVPRFGKPRQDAHLPKAIQSAFDPAATFAPQRLGYLR